MLTLDYILNNYDKFETPLEDRLGHRLAQFLTDEQMAKIGMSYNLEEGQARPAIVPFTEENVLKQLREDCEFGIEKATNHRGISAGLMYEVCQGWCIILENGLEDTDYEWYGCGLFKAIDEYYNFGLVGPDTFDDEFYEEW